jgi:prophage antirepressor-like protein
MYRGSAYPPKEYRRWLANRVQPLLRKHGLDRPARLDPATGVVRAAGAIGVRRAEARGLIAAELSPAAAAAIQPTLF